MKTLFLLLITLLLFGCVETLEKNLPPISDTQNPVPELINYPGVYKASSPSGLGTRAISDTRVEVYFPPAAGGSGKFIYDVFVGSNEKYSFTTETLEKNKIGGYYVVTIPNREIFSKNSIRVEVKDALRFAQSDTKNSVEITTFANEVCQFDGIATASNLAGAEGKDALRIKWVPALWTGPQTPSTPIYYEITLLENGIERDRMHDPILSEAQGRVVRTTSFVDGKNETIVRGLKMNTRYLITVRCIHMGSIKNDFLPELYSEQNTKVVTLSTLDGNLSTIDFNESEMGLSLLGGSDGYTGLTASWGLTQGAFDHFRIYIKKKSVSWGPITSDCSINYSNPDSIACKKVAYNQLNTTMTGLIRDTEYEARFVICGENNCGELNSQGSTGRLVVDFPQSIKTTPSLATFEGVKSIALITDLSEIGAVSLGFVKPSLNSGYAEDYVVTVKRGSSGAFAPIADEGLTLDSYNMKTADKLIVRGLKFGEINDYCFRIQIKVGNNTDTNGSQKCVNVSGNPFYKISGTSLESNINFLPPSSTTEPKEFAGLLGASIQQPSGENQTTETIKLIWKKPTAGFYFSYDFYTSSGVLTSNDLFTENKKSLSLDAFYMDNFVRSSETGEIHTEISLPKQEKFSIALSTGFPGLGLERNSCVWYCCPKLTNTDTSKSCEGTSSLPNPNFKCFSSCPEQLDLD